MPVLARPVFLEGAEAGFIDGRDHDIFVGQIEEGDAREGRPLLFFGGKYAKVSD